MHRTLRSARTAAALALTLGVALVLPGAAFAGTTEPTPATTTSTTSTTSTGTTTTTEPTGSTTSTATTTTTTSSEPTTTTPGTGSATADPSTPSTPAKATSPTAGLVRGGNASRFGLKAAAVGPATSTDPTLVGAGYLVRELAAGGHVFSVVIPDVGTFPDYGVTADAVLALDAAGSGQDEATLATTELAKHAVDYIGFGDRTEIAIGATAKLLLLSLAQGVDPRAFGGYDLVATLQGREQVDGHFADQTKYTDGSNVFGQSLALMALDRGGFPVSAAAVNFLRDQQCTDGGFRLFYAQPNDPPCSSDPDATAMAVQALIAVAGSSDADAVSGLNFLAARQTASGGIGGGGPQTGMNANTTGLAGQAFLAGGRSAQARLTTSYLTALQYGCDFPAALRGGIAYDQTAFDAQAGAGTGAQPQDQDRRSTSQALLALAGTPLFAVSATGADATAPALACAASTTSTTTSSTTTSSTSASSTGGGSNTSAPADAAAAPAASATPGNLAFTGSNVAAMVLLAVLLLGVGATALVVSRRKGVHA